MSTEWLEKQINLEINPYTEWGEHTAKFKPRSEWTIEDYEVWLQIAEYLLKEEREKSIEFSRKLRELSDWMREKGF